MNTTDTPSKFISLLIALPALLLIGLSLFSLSVTTRDSLLRDEKAYLSNQMAEVASVVRAELSLPIVHLQGTVKTPAIQNALRLEENERQVLRAELSSLLYRTPNYIGAQWLDATGKSLLELSLLTDQLEVLDNHHDSFAFLSNSDDLKPYEVLVSPPTLLREQGDLVRPFQAVIHYTIRLPSDHGYVVLTKSINQYSQRLSDTDEPYWIALDNGQWLWHQNSDWLWSNEFDYDYTVENTEPGLWQQLQQFPNHRSNKWGIIEISAKPNTYYDTPVTVPNHIYWIYQLPTSEALSLRQVLVRELRYDAVFGLVIFLAIASWIHFARLRNFQLKVHQQALQERTEIAEQFARSKSEFLANMSHEIRTPMNAILGLIELVQDDPLTEKQREKVNQIQLSGKLLVTIINDILDLSKIESGRLTLNPEPLCIGELLEHVKALFEGIANEKGLTLESRIDPTLFGFVSVDGQRLSQVLNNLVSNALKFTSEGGVTLIGKVLSESDHSISVKLCVSDTGKGIAEDKLSKIFESFSQEDASITRQYGGTGLGLAISQKLVVQMGSGGIEVSSKVKQGSEFSFELTLAKTEAATENSAESDSCTVAGREIDFSLLTVVVVDDTPANLMVAQAMLAKLGCAVVCLSSGAELFGWLANHTCNLILLDVQMPEMSGLEVARHLRSTAAYKNLPIVALSAATLDEDVKQALASGMNSHLAKPFTYAQLKLEVAMAMQFE